MMKNSKNTLKMGNLMIAKIRSSESNHWYTRDGSPMYTVPSKKDGSPRNTTLRDGRELGLIPSVTTILGVAAKPALIAWMQQNVLLAALTLPRCDNESENDYVVRIIKDSKAQGRAAADMGTEIHAAIEAHYEGKTTSKHLNHVLAVTSALDAYYGVQKWIPEKSFAHDIGFAGKTDLHVSSGGGIVVDTKTKEFDDPEKVEAYDENLMQLAAYRVGLGLPMARCANIFVSRNHPGLVKIISWSEDDLKRGFDMFTNLLNYWMLKNKFEVKNA